MKIFNIHNHSTYSILDGIGTPDQWAKYISENPDKFAQGLSLSEHGTLNGIIETYNAANKYNLKYLPSCEIYMNDTFKKDGERYHLVLFGIDRKGFDQLILANNITIQRGQVFKSRTGKKSPIVTLDILQEVVGNDKGHLKCSGACIGGYWNFPLSRGDVKTANIRLKQIIDIFGKENTYLEYQTYKDNTDHQIKVNFGNKLFKQKYNLKTIITSDAHVLKKEDLIYQVMATAMSWKIPLRKYLEKRSPHESVWLKGYEDFMKEIKEYDFKLEPEDIKEAVQETLNIYDSIQKFSLFKEQKFVFHHNHSEEEKFNKFKALITTGWNKKITGTIPSEKINIYKERLKYEINILKKKNFIDYFLAVEEIISTGRQRGIVFGVGRGSAASSLTSYLLNITGLDPIKHNLIFERFISEDRVDYPDIDVDVSDRENVINLIQELYPDHDVTVVANKGKFGIKNLINSFFKVANITYPKKSYVQSGYYYSDLVDKYGLDQYDVDGFLALQEVKDLQKFLGNAINLKKVMDLFIKNLFSIGVHAGGVCILPKNQTDVPLTPVSNDKYAYGSGFSESGSYRELEYVGQIKFDFLGIKTLRIFEEVGKILIKNGKTTKEEIDNLLTYKGLDVNDESAYIRINTLLTDGFFQIGSKGMKGLIQKLQPMNIEELAQLIALYRPGPLKAGMGNTMLKVKENPSLGIQLWPEDILPYIEDIIKPTNYHILYQEQIMFIGKAIGNYGAADLNNFRNFISKGDTIKRKDPKKFSEWQKRFYDTFISKGKEKGISKESLEELWNKMKKFSSYSFVKCLSSDTLVRTKKGLKEIKYVKANDIVYSYDIDTDNIIETKVIENHKNGKKKIYSIETSKGDVIKCTLDHKFLTNKNEMRSLREILDNNLFIKKVQFKENNQNNNTTVIIKFIKETLKEAGYCETYDLEINHKDHNFLIGKKYLIVTSNSHAVSYAYNSFMCAHMSNVYPIEWFTSLLRHEDPIEFLPIIKEQIEELKYDINIIVPRVNNIFREPTIVDNNIVLGINQIKGIGEKAAIELSNIKGTYNSFQEFIESKEYSKHAVNKGVIEKLITIGFFDNIETNRSKLLLDFNFSKRKKSEMKNINIDNYLVKLYDFSGDKQLFFYQAELSMIGTAISEFPYYDLVNKINGFMYYEVKSYSKDKTPIMKIITGIKDVRVKKTKTGKEYYTVKLKDIDGKITWCNIFTRGIQEMKTRWNINLKKGKRTYANDLFMFYYTESGNWKNFLALVPLKRFINST